MAKSPSSARKSPRYCSTKTYFFLRGSMNILDVQVKYIPSEHLRGIVDGRNEIWLPFSLAEVRHLASPCHFGFAVYCQASWGSSPTKLCGCMMSHQNLPGTTRDKAALLVHFSTIKAFLHCVYWCCYCFQYDAAPTRALMNNLF